MFNAEFTLALMCATSVCQNLFASEVCGTAADAVVVVVDPGGFDTPNLRAKSTEHTRAALLSVCVDYTHVVYSAFLTCIIDEN